MVRWLDTPQPRPQRAKFPPERIRTGDSRSALGPDTGSAQIQLSFRGVPAKIQPTLKRTAEDYLSAWQVRPGRKPLVVRGARQVGKTYLIEAWGAAHFESVVTVDLERERDLHSLFSQQDPQRSLEELSVLKGRAVRPGKTLLFLDEIQACPPALASLRYFHELMPELHVVAAGSMLDFALRDFTYSMPVGRIEFLHLQPLSFEEFLEATEGAVLVEYLTRLSLLEPPSEAVENRLLEALRRYFFCWELPFLTYLRWEADPHRAARCAVSPLSSPARAPAPVPRSAVAYTGRLGVRGAA